MSVVELRDRGVCRHDDRPSTHNHRSFDNVFELAKIAGEVMSADLGKGAHRDALLMGTSLVLEVMGEADSPKGGVERAAAALDDGSAEKFLATFRTHFGGTG